MKKSSFVPLISLLLLGGMMLCCVMTAHAQPGEITADPNAQQLRVLWQIAGNPAGGDHVGDGSGSLGDINGDGLGDWAVRYGTLGEWRVFYGNATALSTTPVWTFASSVPEPAYPIVGNFYGSGHNVVGFMRRTRETIDDHDHYYHHLHLFRTDSGRIDSVESAILDTRRMVPKLEIDPRDVLAADLDGDGADELILLTPGALRDGVLSDYAEIWIYKGGAGFQVDSPTVIIRDTEVDRSIIGMQTGDFDGDGHVDIAMVGTYPGRSKLQLFWSTGRLTDFADTTNRRIVELTAESPTGDDGITGLDCDGDGVSDLVLDRFLSGRKGVYLFRSGAGKSARTRSYTMSDADQSFYRAGYRLHHRGGHLSDSSGRYDMLMLIQPSFEGGDPSGLLGFSGGDQGPDRSYDAQRMGNSLFTLGAAVLDVDGDGWDEYLSADAGYGGFGSGIAVIFAGGPYIPSPTHSGVEAVAGEGHVVALTVWPQPAREEVHIAWRGDLKKMPRRFVVHDMVGREVARGEVESWRGEALWHCAGVASGAYVLSVYDAQGSLITSARLVKA
jgi:hypothetical protein